MNPPSVIALHADPESYAQALSEAARTLLRGELAILPAEGLYGLHAAALAKAALARLAHLKQRPPGRGFILLVGTAEQAGAFVARLPGVAADLIARAWPGPLTLLLPAGPTVPPPLRPGGLVAVRCPGSRFLRELALSLPSPLVSTSANRRGEAPPAELGQIAPEIRAASRVIVDGGTLAGKGSTVVRPAEDGRLSLVRAGLWVPGPEFELQPDAQGDSS